MTPVDLHILKVPSTSCTASEVNEEKQLRETPIFKSANGMCSSVENKPGSHPPAHQELTDVTTPLGGDSVRDLKKRLIRAQAI